MAEKGIYVNDLRTDIWEHYYQDGSIYMRSNYKIGLRDSTKTHHYKNEIIETKNYRNNHLNGWSYKFSYIPPHELTEKAFYVDDKKIKNISYKTINDLHFTIVDSLFYNDKKRLMLKKSFINNTLKLQIEIKYNISIKDIIQRNITQVNVYEGNNLVVSYFFPNTYLLDFRVESMLFYEFVYYTDIQKPKLRFFKPEQSSLDTETFYMQFPNGKLKSVINLNDKEDVLPRWHYSDVEKQN